MATGRGRGRCGRSVPFSLCVTAVADRPPSHSFMHHSVSVVVVVAPVLSFYLPIHRRRPSKPSPRRLRGRKKMQRLSTPPSVLHTNGRRKQEQEDSSHAGNKQTRTEIKQTCSCSSSSL
ncbi:hypothetical protein GW17_00027479 [Ensete ventricosum]|nr:hypothetical protein GW17_00027479 [Ensete ventricosum]RZR91387.1 hypothetical protein BHM03_00019499 [Ensete ventricosum]